MRLEAEVVTNMVELDQVIGHGARHAEHVASKTTLRWSASRRAWRNEVLCDALEAAMDALIVHIVFNPVTGTYKPGNSGFEELEATINPFSHALIQDGSETSLLPTQPDSRSTLIPVQPYALVDWHTCSTWDSQKGTWSPLKKKRYAPSEDFLWYVKVGYLSHLKLGVEPQSWLCIYVTKYK